MFLPQWILHSAFLTAASITAPWAGAVVLAGYRRHTRIIACAMELVSIARSAALLWEASRGESLYPALMLLFACLAFGATLMLPRRDCTPGTIAGILFLLGSTLLAYSTENLLVLLAAWVMSVIPFWLEGWLRARTWRPAIGLLLSSLVLAIAVALISASTGVISIDSLKG